VDTTVKQIGAVVVGELRAAGYLDSTIGQYEKTIRALAVFVEEHGGVREKIEDGAVGACDRCVKLPAGENGDSAGAHSSLDDFFRACDSLA